MKSKKCKKVIRELVTKHSLMQDWKKYYFDRYPYAQISFKERLVDGEPGYEIMIEQKIDCDCDKHPEKRMRQYN